MSIIQIKKRDGTVLDLLVSPEDYRAASAVPWSMAGGKRSVGLYARNTDLGYCHRWVAERMGLLPNPNGVEIDHVDGNRLNNQRENLRLARRVQNNGNAIARRGSSRFKGVSWAALPKAWQAHIMKDYHSIYLGLYETEEDAARAYDLAAIEVFGEFARINLPDRISDPRPQRRPPRRKA